ncbi:MAG: hypothetical protein AD742_15575 [Methylibium sp. NZG]|nr:MAG: hypothetical protein AD742_15575 [Methylibium sp. NZG]
MLRVCVAYSPRASEVEEVPLTLPGGATVLQALTESGLLRRYPHIDLGTAKVGVWGSLQPLDHRLRDQDRVEVYRPLQVDPKEARRLRYRKQRERIKA